MTIRQAILGQRPFGRWAIGVLLVALAVFCTEAAHRWATGTSFVLLWPSQGVAVALLLVFGRTLWPGLWLGFTAVGVFALGYYPPGLTVAASLASALGCLVGVAWIERRGLRRELDNLRDVTTLITGCVLTAAAIVLLRSTVFLAWGFDSLRSLEYYVPHWFLQCLMGILILSPAILTLGTARHHISHGASIAELALTLLLLVTTAVIGVTDVFDVRHVTTAYLPLPLIFWIAVRHGTHASALSVLFVAGTAVWGASRGTGPFAIGRGGDSMDVLLTGLALAMIATTALLVAGLVAERRRVVDALAHAGRSLRESIAAQDVLNALTRRLTGPADVTGVAREVAAAARRLFEFDAFGLYYISDDGANYRGVYGEDTGEGETAPREVPLDDLSHSSVHRHMVETHEPVLIPTFAHRPADLIRFGEERVSHCLMFAPLLWEGSLVGTITVQSYTDGRFDDDDLELLAVLANQCSGAMARQDADEARREMERQLLNVQKLEALGTLAGSVAHDFNNLLQNVLGRADLIEGRIEASSAVAAHLKSIRTSVEHARDLCNRLLDFTARREVKLEDLDPGAGVRELSQLFGIAVPKGCSITCHVEPGTPRVYADPTQFRQAVMNLITNAGDAVGPDGAISIRVEGARRAETGKDLWARITVADDGCGMDETTRARIFDPFFTTKEEGRGLGLPAVRSIVETHGGALEIESARGRGTTMTMWWPPLAQAALSRTGQFDPPPLADDTEHAPGVVLFCDDEAPVRELGRELLEGAGHTVLLASDGRQALDIFQRRHADIDVVLLDITMPRMHGIEAVPRFRAISPGTPVILMSGYHRADTSQLISEELIAGFIQKPYRPAELLRLIRSVRVKAGEKDATA